MAMRTQDGCQCGSFVLEAKWKSSFVKHEATNPKVHLACRPEFCNPRSTLTLSMHNCRSSYEARFASLHLASPLNGFSNLSLRCFLGAKPCPQNCRSSPLLPGPLTLARSPVQIFGLSGELIILPSRAATGIVMESLSVCKELLSFEFPFPASFLLRVQQQARSETRTPPAQSAQGFWLVNVSTPYQVLSICLIDVIALFIQNV